MQNYTNRFYRAFLRSPDRQIGEWDGHSYRYDWSDRTDLVEHLSGEYGDAWETIIEIQLWEVSEKRVV